MKECRKTKDIVLSMAMALALPIGATAQEGLFQRGVADEAYYGFGSTNGKTELLGHRSVLTQSTINNQVFGQPVPVGSGVLVLLAAGAGYAVLKRKEDEQ